jgi:1-acyl-sn-glycerol-3-phosphate acyltransferase
MLRVVLVSAAFVVLTAILAIALTVLSLLRLPGRGGLSIAYSRVVCALLGVRVRVEGTPPAGRPVLILANHVSWLDILVITATAPVIFVAKSEVAAWPLIGRVARARGTVFVERGRRHQTSGANSAIAGFLAEGQSIVLFAEGTSSDGNRVLPFRSALVGALKEALAQGGADIAVQPLSIAYTRIQGLPMGRQHRPLVAWYGERDLVPHVREFLLRAAVDVTLSWGEPVAYDGAHRKLVVGVLQRAVRSMTAAALSGRPAIAPAKAPAASAAAPEAATAGPSGVSICRKTG